MTLALRYAALSHVGLLRTLNEDSGYGGPRLLAIADGMGGHAAGEVASAVAISSLAALDVDDPGADLTTALRTAATHANDHLREMVVADTSLDGMGTTLTALLFEGSRLGVLHVGDSRCYLLRDGELAQITHDDTLVQSLVDEGRITAAEASTHPQRNLITNALDGRPDVTFDLSVREARAGDRYLLCSDGLTGPVGSLDTLRDVLRDPDPLAAAQHLVELALRGGGPDNITVVVADVADVAEDGSGTGGTPLIVGAAAESAPPSPALDGGPAGRAAQITEAAEATAPTGPLTERDAEVPARRRPRASRVALLMAALLVLVAAAGFGGYALLRTQWYVGVDHGNVAVFRGVDGSVAGISLHRLQTRTDLPVTALTELERDRLADGMDAADRADAERIVTALRAGAGLLGTGTGTGTATPSPTATTPTVTSPPSVAPSPP